MKAQDILLLLKLISIEKYLEDELFDASVYAVRNLAKQTGLGKSEVSLCLNRCYKSGLLKNDRKHNVPKVNKKAVYEFILYGLKYVFPADVGTKVRGIATTFSSPAFENLVASSSEDIFVWPYYDGKKSGLSINPIYKSAPEAAMKDSFLYGLLALTDAVRVGKAREKKVAASELKKLFGI